MLAALIVAGTGCTSDDAGTEPTSTSAGLSATRGGPAQTIAVPGDAETVQAAVDAARPGDLVFISPGIYRESVTVTTPGIVIRGADRTSVVFDGENERENGIFVSVDGVAVENLTVQRYRSNGIYFTGSRGPDAQGGSPDDEPLEGYRVSYVTAANNGLYGVYAFASKGGLVEHSYASGHPDSGFYVGQCDPCDVVFDDVTAERNAVGFLATNASTGVLLVRSEFRANRTGIALNSEDIELLAPQHDAIVVGNLVDGNGWEASPGGAEATTGVGVLIGGGSHDLLTRNRVVGSDGVGVLLAPLDGHEPRRNKVEANVFGSNALDMAIVAGTAADAGELANCFGSNVSSDGDLTTSPVGLHDLMPCPPTTRSTGAVPAVPLPTSVAGPAYRDVPLPVAQPSMPSAATEAPRPVGSQAPHVDVEEIDVPA